MYDFRPATREDAAIIAVQRHRMFLAMGRTDDKRLRAIIANFLPWVRDAIQGGTYLGYLAALGHEVVAGAGMMIHDWPPGPRDPSPRPQRGYIFNVFTEAAHRKRGLAGQLVRLALEEARLRGIRVVGLHFAPGTHDLYQSLGFTDNNEMIWHDAD